MILNFIVGIIMGVITGFGIGGGSLFIIYLTMFSGFEQILAQGINLVYFLFSATPALYWHIKNRLVIKKAMIYCSVSGVVTSVTASYFANNINTDILRRIFGVFLIYVGITLVFSKKPKNS